MEWPARSKECRIERFLYLCTTVLPGSHTGENSFMSVGRILTSSALHHGTSLGGGPGR